MSRTPNPYEGQPAVKYRAEQWAAGYKAHRDGLTMASNPYLMPGFVRRWDEGFAASVADVKRGID